MEIKTLLRFSLIPVKMAIINTTNAGKEWGGETLYTVVGNVV
jgi:hypothetical protein